MRFSTAFTLALPAVVLATAVTRNDGDCNTGDMLCCNSVQTVWFALGNTISRT